MPRRPARELLERLKNGERFVADGAMGSELIRRGIAPEEILRTNRERAETIREVLRAYVAAGSRILTSNTFGFRDGADWTANVRAGVALAVEVAEEADQDVFVWVSLVPAIVVHVIGALRFVAADQAGWPGALLVETCTALPAAVAATQAARSLNPDLLAVTCHFGADGRMPDGTRPELAARTLTRAGADIVGGNCGDAPETFVDVAVRMRAATKAPLLFQPSAGLPQRERDGAWVYPIGPQEFAAIAERLITSGANIVGGCCGAGPEYIRAVQARLSEALKGRDRLEAPGRRERQEKPISDGG